MTGLSIKWSKKSLVVSKRKYFLGQIENCFDVFYVCTKKKQMRLVVHTFLFVLSYSVFKKSKCAEKHIFKLRISILWNAKYSEENRLLVQGVKNYLIANKQTLFSTRY